MTSDQDDPSANKPWTSTTFRAVVTAAAARPCPKVATSVVAASPVASCRRLSVISIAMSLSFRAVAPQEAAEPIRGAIRIPGSRWLECPPSSKRSPELEAPVTKKHDLAEQGLILQTAYPSADSRRWWLPPTSRRGRHEASHHGTCRHVDVPCDAPSGDAPPRDLLSRDASSRDAPSRAAPSRAAPSRAAPSQDLPSWGAPIGGNLMRIASTL